LVAYGLQGDIHGSLQDHGC